MSEFECSNGHMPAPSQMVKGRCPCGAAIVRVDGKSKRQLAYEEKQYNKQCGDKNLEEKEEQLCPSISV